MTTPTQDVFADLAITPTEEPLPEARRMQAGPNPFTEPLKASVAHNTAYSVYIPNEGNAVQRAVFLINQAARRENLGVRVVVNVRKDKDGKVVKDKDGKATYIVEANGANKGKVLVRFQGKAERKGQKTVRLFSIVKVKGTDDYVVREMATQRALFRGTQEDAKQFYANLKDRIKNDPEYAAQFSAE